MSMKQASHFFLCALMIVFPLVALQARQSRSSATDTRSAHDPLNTHEAITAHKEINWYIGAPVLNLLYQNNPTLAAKNFNRPNTFVAVTQQSQLALIPSGWNVTPVFTFFDEKKLNAAITQNLLPSKIKGVVLDDELAVCLVYGSNNCTPMAEQKDPVPYEQDAARLAAQHGLIYLDVGAAPDPRQKNFRFHAAAFADYVDSQIQLAESNRQKFDMLASSYEAGWNSALPMYAGYQGTKAQTAKVIIGIGARVRTCPAGTKGCKNYVTANFADVVAAVKNTQSLPNLWGYWLNCPSGKPVPSGPGPCGPSDVQAMEQFLNIINP